MPNAPSRRSGRLSARTVNVARQGATDQRRKNVAQGSIQACPNWRRVNLHCFPGEDRLRPMSCRRLWIQAAVQAGTVRRSCSTSQKV